MSALTEQRIKATSLCALFFMAFVLALPFHMAHDHHCHVEDVEIHQHDGEHPVFEFTTVGLIAQLVMNASPDIAKVVFATTVVGTVDIHKSFIYKSGHFEQQRLRGPPLA